MRRGERERLNRRSAEREAQGILKRCPVTCPCMCHDTQGGVHDHPGEPCWGKRGLPVPPIELIWSHEEGPR